MGWAFDIYGGEEKCVLEDLWLDGTIDLKETG